MFVAEVLSVKFQRRLEMISAEFPLLKPSVDGLGPSQSTNIDWLLYDTDQDQLVFLELKTTDTTFDQEQDRVYSRMIDRVNVKDGNAEFLVTDLRKIRK